MCCAAVLQDHNSLSNQKQMLERSLGGANGHTLQPLLHILKWISQRHQKPFDQSLHWCHKFLCNYDFFEYSFLLRVTLNMLWTGFLSTPSSSSVNLAFLQHCNLFKKRVVRKGCQFEMSAIQNEMTSRVKQRESCSSNTHQQLLLFFKLSCLVWFVSV